MSDKAAKSEVEYSRGHYDAHCGRWHDADKAYCRHFREPDGCTEVEGKISHYYWCTKFEKVKQ